MTFKKAGKYSVPSDEDFEPDSNNEVIKNYLGIKSKEIMDEIEQSELKRTEYELVNIYDQDYRFKAEDICNIHELWLGSELAYALGIVHVELILIHPFREGNGRAARLLADLMAMQANMPPLNYLAIDQTENPKGFDQYIEAIHAGVSEDYSRIQSVFSTLLQQSV